MTPETAETQRQRPVVKQQWITCGRCPARWTGSGRAHCGSGCHLTFSTVANFDRHRSNRGEHGQCLDPADVGLVERGGVWAMPSDPANVERLRQLRKTTAKEGPA